MRAGRRLQVLTANRDEALAAVLSGVADLAVVGFDAPGAEADGWDLLVHFASLGLGATVVIGCVEVPAGFAAVPVTGMPPVRCWAAWRERVAELVERMAT